MKKQGQSVFNGGVVLIILGILSLIIVQYSKTTDRYADSKLAILMNYSFKAQQMAHIVDTIFIFSFIAVAIGIGLLIVGSIVKSKN